ncbi:MAG: putative porin [Nitrospirota bacterium]
MKRGVGAALVGLLTLSYAATAAAEGRVPLEELLFDKGILTKDEAASVQKKKFSSLIDRITFNNDIRLRYETFYMTTADDRYRMRFRLRLGADVKLDTITVGIRLASGTGEQVSTNQTFDNLSSQKAIWIDRAYIRWQGDSTRWLSLTGGRMPNPFFTVYSSDVVWDDDFNPEGVAENLKFKLGGAELFVNLAQIVLDEDSSGKPDTDQWLFGQQVGATASPVHDVKTTLAVAYYNAVNVQYPNGTLSQSVVQSGNSRCDLGPPVTPTGCVANQLINDYNVVDITAMVGFKVLSLPVSVMADYVTNTADTVDSTGADTEDSGYQAGLILGKASAPQTWEVAYFYKQLGTDATLADISDSDFGTGGTDRKGSIVWAAYNPNKALQVKVKYFKTKIEDDQAAPNDINRLQADLSVKF